MRVISCACAFRASLFAVVVLVVSALPDASSIRASSSLYEDFGTGWDTRWVHSEDAKYDGKLQAMQPSGWDNNGLQSSGIPVGTKCASVHHAVYGACYLSRYIKFSEVPEGAKHYGISALLDTPCDPSNGIVFQYEVRFTKGITCGGAYMKLLTVPTAEEAAAGASLNPKALTNDSPYSIMFGPDKCGTASGKVHLILRHRNPLNGSITEKHITTAPEPVKNANSHVYTLTLKPDSSFSILIDGNISSVGSLLEDFSPPFNPPTTILDPSDVKPLEWSDHETIADLSVAKPAEWDDRAKIPDVKVPKPEGWLDDVLPTIDDPEAAKPGEWDEEEDGEWAAPQVANPLCTPGCGVFVPPMWGNPDYKGAWAAPQIPNPEYKGAWVQKSIPNPDLYDDKTPLASIGIIGAAAIEIWTMDAGYVFDHILLAPATPEGVALAEALRTEGWAHRGAAEDAADDAETAAIEAAAAVQEAAKSKATKAAQEARAAKAAESSSLYSRAASFDGYLTTIILGLFDKPPLEALKQTAAPALKLLASHPQLSYAVVALPLLTIILLIMLLTGSKATPPQYRPTSVSPEPSDISPKKKTTGASPIVAEVQADADDNDDSAEEQAEDMAAGGGEIRPQTEDDEADGAAGTGVAARRSTRTRRAA